MGKLKKRNAYCTYTYQVHVVYLLAIARLSVQITLKQLQATEATIHRYLKDRVPAAVVRNAW